MSRLTANQVLGRLTFGPTSAQRDRFDGASADEVVASLLDDPPVDVAVPGPWDLDTEEDYWAPTNWWLDVMRHEQAGLHEKLVWFWHGHLTSSIGKTSHAAMIAQHERIRRLARGNFRDLLREMTTDVAMLHWLDGSGSDAASPNENHARELLELFTLGRGNSAYDERDVHAAATAMAGWWADGESLEVGFDPGTGPARASTVVGRSCRSVDDVVDAVCDHPACAPHVASRLAEFLTGVRPPDDVRRELGDRFASSGLDIDVLVRHLCTHPWFATTPPRPRSAVEWFVGAERALGSTLDVWTLELLGQVPLSPPNVAGWPGSARWVSAGAVITKAEAALGRAWDAPTLDDRDRIADATGRAGLDALTPSTRSALTEAISRVDGRREASSLLLALVTVTHEFNET
jgi:uncharacterized protein (DUF1800 family)